MNICFLCRTFQQSRGGTESYYFRMANALSAGGHIVHIITQKGKEDSYSKFLNQSVFLHTIDFIEEPFKGSWRLEKYFPLSRIRYSMAVAKKIKEIQQKHKIDIVQSPDWSSEGFWLSVHKKVPLFIRLHGVPDYSAYLPSLLVKPDLKLRLIWMMSKYMVLHADGVSCVSNDFAQRVKKILNTNKPIQVIYNGVNQTIYQPGNIPQRERAILFVGRIEEFKGIEIVAKAIPEVLNNFPDLKFVFAGRMANYKNISKTWVDYLTKEFPNNITLLGQIPTEEVVSCYQKYLISIFPSLYEPGGAAALEAMACGCAVIATKIGGFTESIEDGVDGLLISPNDPQALACAIKELLTDDMLRERISTNAINKITTEFSLANAVDQTVSTYEKIIIKTKDKENLNFIQWFRERSTFYIKERKLPYRLLRLKQILKACSGFILGLFLFYFGPKKQIVVITGCMRTGTTLLKALLAEAEDVSHLPEVSFGHYAASNPYLALYRIYSLSEKRIIVLKKPVTYVDYNNVPFENSFMRLKIIITIRNPYDTLISLKNMSPDKEYPELVEYWCRSMELILTDKRLFSHNVLFIKYEDLIKNPVAQTEQIFKFINSRRTQGVNTYGKPTTFKWEWGKDDGGEKIKTGKVQESKNIPRNEELLQLLKNHKKIKDLAKKFGYSGLWRDKNDTT